MPGPHHSTGYLPNVNPHPDPNEPQSHNMPCNVLIPNPRHPRSAYGTHEVSSIHLQQPHPISQVGPDLLSQSLSITHLTHMDMVVRVITHMLNLLIMCPHTGLILKLIHWHPCPHPIILVMCPIHSSLMLPPMLGSLFRT